VFPRPLWGRILWTELLLWGGAEKVTTLNAYWFHVSFAGLGLGIGLVTAGLDYNTGNNTDGWWRGVVVSGVRR